MDPRDSPREGHLCGGGGGGWPSCTACCVQQGVPPALHPEQTWAAPTSVRWVLTWSSFMLLTSSSACIRQSLHRGRAEKNQVARTSPRARSLLRPVRVRVRVSEPEATWLRPPHPAPFCRADIDLIFFKTRPIRHDGPEIHARDTFGL